MANRDSGNKSRQQSSSGQGFASMDEKRQREIASEGAHASQESGRAHDLTPEEARKGGEAAQESGHAHDLTAAESRKGGESAQQSGRAHDLTAADSRKGSKSSHGGR